MTGGRRSGGTAYATCGIDGLPAIDICDLVGLLDTSDNFAAIVLRYSRRKDEEQRTFVCHQKRPSPGQDDQEALSGKIADYAYLWLKAQRLIR